MADGIAIDILFTDRCYNQCDVDQCSVYSWQMLFACILQYIEDGILGRCFMPIVEYGRCYSHVADGLAIRVDLFQL